MPWIVTGTHPSSHGKEEKGLRLCEHMSETCLETEHSALMIHLLRSEHGHCSQAAASRESVSALPGHGLTGSLPW